MTLTLTLALNHSLTRRGKQRHHILATYVLTLTMTLTLTLTLNLTLTLTLTLTCRGKQRHHSLATYILLRGLNLLVSGAFISAYSRLSCVAEGWELLVACTYQPTLHLGLKNAKCSSIASKYGRGCRGIEQHFPPSFDPFEQPLACVHGIW